MHILFLTDNFFPESNAPANRTFEHAKVWINDGHIVTVITSNPNFPEGKIHKGYRNFFPFRYEDINGIKVIRVWTLIAENKGFFLRIIDQLSYAFTAFFAGLFVKKVDIIIGTSPQFFTIFATYALSLIKNKKWVFEVRDLWPESLLAVGVLKRGLLYRLLHRIEKHFYHSANHIIALTKSFKSQIVSYGVSESKVTVITNGIDRSMFHANVDDGYKTSEGFHKDDFLVSYIGTIGMAHSINTIIETARLFSLRNISNVKFLLYGSGAEASQAKELIEKINIKNIFLKGKVERKLIPTILKSIDISLVILKNDPAFLKVIPSKIFESIAMGVPILIGVKGESREFVTNNGFGEYFEPDNPQALFEAILKLMNNPDQLELYSKNSQNNHKYSRELLARKMLKSIQYLHEKK